jgi:protein-disulfide isomerase
MRRPGGNFLTSRRPAHSRVPLSGSSARVTTPQEGAFLNKRRIGCLSLAALGASLAAASTQAPQARAAAQDRSGKTVAAATSVSLPAGKAEIDKPVANFAVANVAGNGSSTFRLSDHKGKRNVVMVWMSYNCSVTRAYEERLGKLLAQYSTPGSDTVFVGVHANAPETNDRIKRYAQTTNFTGPVLDDKQRNPGLTEYFGVRATPTVVIIDKKGVYRFKGRIDNNPGDVRGEDTARKQLVVNALASIKSGKEIAIKTSPTPG